MIYKKVHLNKYYPLKYDPILEIFSLEITDGKKRPLAPFILVVPGGGYNFVSHREKDPICVAYMKEGFVCASLTYTVKPQVVDNERLFPHPHLELAAAIDYLKKHHIKYRIDNHKFGLIGFSAGGHLAGSFSYLYDKLPEIRTLGISNIEALKPSFQVLAYPVVSLKEHTHLGTFNCLTNGDSNLCNILSIHENITKDYPPTFIWNTMTDLSVPQINSKLLYDALIQKGVKTELIQYKEGPHGLSLVDCNTTMEEKERNKYQYISEWFKHSINFINNVIYKYYK